MIISSRRAARAGKCLANLNLFRLVSILFGGVRGGGGGGEWGGRRRPGAGVTTG